MAVHQHSGRSRVFVSGRGSRKGVSFFGGLGLLLAVLGLFVVWHAGWFGGHGQSGIVDVTNAIRVPEERNAGSMAATDDAVRSTQRQLGLDPNSPNLAFTPAISSSKLKSNSSGFLKASLIGFKRRYGPEPLLRAAENPKCSSQLAAKLKGRAAKLDHARNVNERFILNLVEILAREDFHEVGRDSAGPSSNFFPMSRFDRPSDGNQHPQDCPGVFDSLDRLIAHLARDWSDEYRHTAGKINGLLVEMVTRHVKARGRVLVPGAGLGRLAFELARLGYQVEMNDCSPLITSVAHAIFSHIRASEPLFPFSHLWKNVPKGDESDQLASFPVPDVVPGLVAVSELGNGNTLSPILITQGDFSRIYSTTEKIEKYDAVVANFFIDKAGGGDTLLALEQVAAPLKRGGVLLVAGPLDWKNGASPMLTVSEVLEFWSTHPILQFNLLERTQAEAEYSRREGKLLAGERYLVPVVAMRRSG